MRDGLADHWSRILRLRNRQVNENGGVGRDLKGLLLKNPDYAQNPLPWTGRGQCIMKERPAFQGRSWRGAASAALRCAGLRSATAALGSKWSGVSGAKGLQQSIGKSAGEWHFTLGGEVSVDANDLSPKEATAMSGDIKYIGMDIHKEAIVIAVLNGSGKLVMETVVETKASSILEFLHGLRGELHVT